MHEVADGATASTVEFHTTPGYGDWALANMRYHQALRIGNRVEISGQGGWDDEVTFPEADAALSKTAMTGYYSFFVN